MDFKKLKSLSVYITVVLLFMTGCDQKEKTNTNNTFYIELVNFNNDSLKQSISEKLFGKVSFYKNNKLEILSENYLTEDYPDMHFIKNAEELTKDIKPETKKIKVTFTGNYSPDSIKYSMKKYIYRDKQWKQTYDLGIVTANNTHFRTRQFAIDQYGKQLSSSIIAYTYD